MFDLQPSVTSPFSRPILRQPKHAKPRGVREPVDAVRDQLEALRPVVLDLVRGHGEGLSFRAIARALGRKSGQAHATPGLVPHSRVVMLLDLMCAQRELVRMIRENETRYRLPMPNEDWGSPIRDIPVPAFSLDELEQTVLQVLRSRPRGCIKSELVGLTHAAYLHATTETVMQAVRTLIKRGQARMVPFGAFVRYEAVQEHGEGQ